MTEFAVQPLQLTDRRSVSLLRIVFIALASAVLIAGAFVLGRVTAGSTGHTIGSVSTVQQPMPGAPVECRAPGPC